jgi:HK97 family phage portal protein
MDVRQGQREMILTKAARAAIPQTQPKIDEANSPRAEYISSYGESTKAGKRVSPEGARTIATAYRAANIISDDVAKMPFKQYRRVDGRTEQIKPDATARNMPYLLQVSPNVWGWTPFQFKKSIVQWQLFHGNAYIWQPPVWPRQLLILPADRTRPVFDYEGNLYYEVRFGSNSKPQYLPSVEVLHLLINPDATGCIGRGVIHYARETIGRQLGSHETESKFYAQGMNASGILYLNVNEIKDDEERNKLRRSFSDAVSGSENAYNIAVADKRVIKFEQITMNPRDAQFLEIMEATDRDIANFFGIPAHMLNMGKEAYNSNEQKYIEYLQSNLDSYLVAWEEGARIRWLTTAEQSTDYFKFNRDSLLRMTAKERAETNEILIRSAQRTPNEARSKDDLDADPRLDEFYMTNNYSPIGGTHNAQPE